MQSTADESNYQQGVAYLKEHKWEEAAQNLAHPCLDSYKDSEILWNYAESNVKVQKGYIHQATFDAKKILDSYQGPFKEEVLAFKKEMLQKDAQLTPEQIAKEKERQTAEETKNAPSVSSPAPASKPDLELVESHPVSEGLYGSIGGTVKNNTDHQYSYVQVEINLYDAEGAQVGSTLANANNLEAGGTWKFKAVILNEGVKTYKIKEVTGF